MATNPLRITRRSRAEKPSGGPEADPAENEANWLVEPVVVVRADGTERPATSDEIAAIRVTPQPEHVRIERRESGSRTLILEQADYERGEMFGPSNESLGPQFAVTDNELGRRGFDDATRAALENSGIELNEE